MESCVPIKNGKMVLGVLSIDGLKENAFNKDDLDYLIYIANTLSSLMFMEKKFNELLGEENQNDNNKFEESESVETQDSFKLLIIF